MHWLQSLDTALFHFINGSLANPFFDWLMPVLSGYGLPWLPATVLAVAATLVWGSPRLKLCALLMVLVISIGDGLIVNSVKKSISRPRPFVTLPDARLYQLDSHDFKVGTGYLAPLPDGSLPSKANRRSFPSAHAANWFALATVAFLFFRRSGWWMFPLAAGVAFSRVYNGVHYPADVTAGAILGAGYAIALAVALQMIWAFAGRRFFPAWHKRLPNLLDPKPSTIPDSASMTTREWMRLGYLVIAVAFLGRVAYLASGAIGLSGDEAYQWHWSKHLALSYFSKPPGIALIQWVGTSFFGDTELGVRFLSPVFAAILSVIVLRFVGREAGPRPAFFLILATFATPLLGAGSILMTIDPPLVLCWMWATVACWRAVQSGGKTRDWLVAGMAMGLGFLCKYSMLFLPVCAAFYFGLQPSARTQLRKPGPWLALGLLALSTLPVLVWNWQHGWITVHHVADNAGMGPGEHWQPTLKFFVEFLGAQIGLLNPVFFIGMIAACFAFWKIRREKPVLLFLFCMGAPLFFGYWLFSLHSRVLPNWIAPAVPPLFCLMAIYWAGRDISLKRWYAGAMILGLAGCALMHDTGLIRTVAGSKLPGDKDPARRVNGWREASLVIDRERRKFDPDAFVIGENYGATGLYSFYLPGSRAAVASGKPIVYCLMGSDRPTSQFYFWDEYDYRKHRKGQNAIFAVRLRPYTLEPGWIWKWLRGEPLPYASTPPPQTAPERLSSDFESVTSLGIFEARLEDGRVFHRLQIFSCRALK